MRATCVFAVASLMTSRLQISGLERPRASRSSTSRCAALTLRVGAAREALKDAGDAIKQQAYQAVVDALRAKTEDGQVRLARGVLLVTAQA